MDHDIQHSDPDSGGDAAEHRARPHDHLVEPLFAGLGAEDPAEPPARRGRREIPRLLGMIGVVIALIAVLALIRFSIGFLVQLITGTD